MDLLGLGVLLVIGCFFAGAAAGTAAASVRYAGVCRECAETADAYRRTAEEAVDTLNEFTEEY